MLPVVVTICSLHTVLGRVNFLDSGNLACMCRPDWFVTNLDADIALKLLLVCFDFQRNFNETNPHVFALVGWLGSLAPSMKQVQLSSAKWSHGQHMIWTHMVWSENKKNMMLVWTLNFESLRPTETAVLCTDNWIRLVLIGNLFANLFKIWRI